MWLQDLNEVERVAVVQIPLETFKISTRALTGAVCDVFLPPAKKTSSPEEVDARAERASLSVAVVRTIECTCG
jgi:hypothetical protein